jgi:hypothetical protein
LRACCYCYTGIVNPVVDSPPALGDALDATNRDMNHHRQREADETNCR